MDKVTLVEKDVVNAQTLVQALRNSGFPVQMAAWVRRVSEVRYMLFIASPAVQKFGIGYANEKISERLTKEHIDIKIQDVYVANTLWIERPSSASFGSFLVGEGLEEEVPVFRSRNKVKA